MISKTKSISCSPFEQLYPVISRAAWCCTGSVKKYPEASLYPRGCKPHEGEKTTPPVSEILPSQTGGVTLAVDLPSLHLSHLPSVSTSSITLFSLFHHTLTCFYFSIVFCFSLSCACRFLTSISIPHLPTSFCPITSDSSDLFLGLFSLLF